MTVAGSVSPIVWKEGWRMVAARLQRRRDGLVNGAIGLPVVRHVELLDCRRVVGDDGVKTLAHIFIVAGGSPTVRRTVMDTVRGR
jgi:hypothetical protein